MIKKNFVKEKIKKNIPVMGTWNTIGHPLVTEILAQSGLDFVVIDCEHGPLVFNEVNNYVNACEIHEVSPIIRVPSNKDWYQLQSLDQGAHGIIVPHIDTKIEAEEFIKNLKYYPKGTRGFTPFTKAGGFSGGTIVNYPQVANDFILSTVIIESMIGIDNLDQILEIPDLDVVYFGAYDLSQNLQLPGDTRNKKVIDIIEKAAKKVRDAKKCPGGFLAHNEQDLKWQIDMGMQFILFDVDCGVLKNSFSNAVQTFKKVQKS